MVFWRLFMAAVLAVVAAILGFGVPLVIKQILAFIKNQKATLLDQTTAY